MSNLLTLNPSTTGHTNLDRPVIFNQQSNFERSTSRQTSRETNRETSRETSIDRPTTSMHRQTCGERQTSMVVKAQSRGREVIGLEVGAQNARRYIAKDAAAIELQLDHLSISCGLGPEFWDGEAEIRDPRLCAWLEQKNHNGKAGESPAPLAMIPSGKNSFRLQPLASRGPRKSSTQGNQPPLNAA